MTKLQAGGYKPGYASRAQLGGAEQPEGGATDRSFGGRFGMSKGDGVSASVDISNNKFMTRFGEGLQQKQLGTLGGIATQSTTTLNKPGLALNLAQL